MVVLYEDIKSWQIKNIFNIKKVKTKTYFDVKNPCHVWKFYMKNNTIVYFKINFTE